MLLDRNYYRATLLLVGLFCFSPLFMMCPDSNRVMAQTPDARQAEADQLLKQGNEQLNANQPGAALKSLEQALAIYREVKDRSGEGQALKAIGNSYQALEKYDQAMNYQQQALEIAREIQDKDLEAKALNNIGLAYQNLKKSRQAIEYYQQSLAISRRQKNYATEQKTLVNLGYIYKKTGNYISSNEFYEQAISVSKQLNNRQLEQILTSIVGLNYVALEDFKKAIKYFQKSFLIAKEIGNYPNQINTLGGIGQAYVSLGNYGKALEFNNQALRIAQETGDLESEKLILPVVVVFYIDIFGERSLAIKYAERYLEVAQRSSDTLEEVKAWKSLGSVYATLGDSQKSIDFYKKGLLIAQQRNYLSNQIEILTSLGELYNQISMQRIINASSDELKAKVPDLRKASPVELFQTYSRSEITQATIYLEQAVTLTNVGKGRSTLSPTLKFDALMALGNAYNRLGNSQGIDYFNQALEIARKEPSLKNREDSVLVTIGNAYRLLGDNSKALEFFNLGLSLSRARNSSLDTEGDFLGTELSSIGDALYDLGRFQEAEKLQREALEIWKKSWKSLERRDELKVSIFERRQAAYRRLEEILVAQHKFNEALEISEQGRSKVFAEQLSRRLFTTANSDLSSQVDSEPLKIKMIQAIARQNHATLVQYSIGTTPFSAIFQTQPKELFIWVVNPSGEVAFRKVDLSSLNIPLKDLITTSRDALGVRAFPQRATLVVKLPEGSQKQATEYQKQRLQQLHQLLIEPIADLLPKDPSDRVIFIPQGSLFLVPFPALQDANGKYLIEIHTILTAPSIQVLDQTHQLQQQRQSHPAAETLVVGNPTMPIVTPYPGEPPQQLNALPGAEDEANAIAPLLKTQALTGTQGTKAAIKQKMSHARIIHLATHGLLDDLRGLGSAIALAPDHPGTPNDGLLTAEEILDLKLSADLVVLSACDTGRGRITGDGVIGLSRSFISAGVPSIIVSLWAVPDAPTAELMTEFYTNWQVKKLDKAQALRQAILTTMKTHPNPRDWAAFTLIGESQ